MALTLVASFAVTLAGFSLQNATPPLNAPVANEKTKSTAPVVDKSTADNSAQEKAKSDVPASIKPLVIPSDHEAITAAVAQLLALQQKGPGADIAQEWAYEGVYRVGGKIPYGYRVGGTSIVSMALLGAPDFATDSARKDAVSRAIDFVAQAINEPLLSPQYDGGYDVRGWAHCYGLRFLVQAKRAAAVSEAQKSAVDAAIAFYLDALVKTEIPQIGGWQYARSAGIETPCATSPFMTAPCLMTLLEAKASGLTVSDELIERTARALELTRGASGFVAYNASRPARDDTGQIPGAIGRMCAVEVALHAAGKGDEARARKAVTSFFEFWPELEKRRKKSGTHLAPYGVAPYYFFYAFTYAAAAIEILPPAERDVDRAKFRELLFTVRDQDGSWNDRVFAKSAAYGTAMSVLALLEAHSSPSAAAAK